MAKFLIPFRPTWAIGFLPLFLMLVVAVGCGEETRYQLTTRGEPGQGGTVAVDPVPGADNKYPEGARVHLQAMSHEGY